MKYVDTMHIVNAGDVIWQERMPGGWCVVLEVIEWDEENPSPLGWGFLWDTHTIAMRSIVIPECPLQMLT